MRYERPKRHKKAQTGIASAFWSPKFARQGFKRLNSDVRSFFEVNQRLSRTVVDARLTKWTQSAKVKFLKQAHFPIYPPTKKLFRKTNLISSSSQISGSVDCSEFECQIQNRLHYFTSWLPKWEALVFFFFGGLVAFVKSTGASKR